MSHRGFLLVAATAAALWPAAAGAGTAGGVVVAREHGLLLVTSPSGQLRTAVGRAAIGSRVVVARGTASVVGVARRTQIRGVVVATVSIAGRRLELAAERRVGQAAGDTVIVTATVKSVAAGSLTLDIQSRSLVVSLPAQPALPVSLMGQTVTIQLKLADDEAQDEDDDGDHGGGREGHGGGDD